MKLVTHTMLVVGAFIGLMGCAMLGLDQDSPKEVLYKAYSAYVKVYQPLLLGYDKLEYCGSPAKPPCKDKALYRKLYHADAAIMACGVTAKKAIWSDVDYAAVEPCLTRINETQTLLEGIR